VSTVHRVATGTVRVALPAADALELFTPEGERGWVAGWAPAYPAGEPELAEGTVFSTGHGSTAATTWVVTRVDRAGGELAYARVTPHSHAGTVTVRCAADGLDRTVVTVSYDMTALGDAGRDALDLLDPDRYAAYLDSWSEAIAASLGR
jgi:hypothetical protein